MQHEVDIQPASVGAYATDCVVARRDGVAAIRGFVRQEGAKCIEAFAVPARRDMEAGMEVCIRLEVVQVGSREPLDAASAARSASRKEPQAFENCCFASCPSSDQEQQKWSALFGIGYSWGGFQSLALQVHLGDRKVLNPPEGGPLIRLQIGLEDVTDLVKELERAFAACRS